MRFTEAIKIWFGSISLSGEKRENIPDRGMIINKHIEICAQEIACSRKYCQKGDGAEKGWGMGGA